MNHDVKVRPTPTFYTYNQFANLRNVNLHNHTSIKISKKNRML